MSRHQMLSDAQWELIAPMLPARTGRAGRPFTDARTMVEAIIYGTGAWIGDSVSHAACAVVGSMINSYSTGANRPSRSCRSRR